jgi:hypothetical protein
MRINIAGHKNMGSFDETRISSRFECGNAWARVKRLTVWVS